MLAVELKAMSVLVLLDAVAGQVASLPGTPYMRLVIPPPWYRLTSPTNILKSTRAGDNIDCVE